MDPGLKHLPELLLPDNVEDGCLGHSAGELVWNVTYSCNLSCRHCYLPSGMEASELSTEEGHRLIEDARSLFGSAGQVVFSGGEPLLRKDIYELIEHASQLGMRTALATNGTLLSTTVAERLRESGLDEVAVSIDGATSSTHDGVRGVVGSFNAALEAARRVRRVGLSLQLHFTITASNLHELPDVINLASRLGARRLFIFDLVRVGRGLNLERPSINLLALFNYLWRTQRELRVWLKPQCCPYFYVYLLGKMSRELDIEGLRAYFKGCLAGRSLIRVMPDGGITPCPFIPLRLGDVRSSSLVEVWSSSSTLNDLRDRSRLKGSCSSCSNRDVCGGCRAKAYSELGDLLGEDPSCPYSSAHFTMSRA